MLDLEFRARCRDPYSIKRNAGGLHGKAGPVVILSTARGCGGPTVKSITASEKAVEAQYGAGAESNALRRHGAAGCSVAVVNDVILVCCPLRVHRKIGRGNG